MPSIRISKFGGLSPALNSKLIDRTGAEVAHNCLLWDGTLRPMPKWIKLQNELSGYGVQAHVQSYTGLAEDRKTGKYWSHYEYKELIRLDGAPFPKMNLALRPSGGLPDFSGTPININKNEIVGVPAPSIYNADISYEAQNLSSKPVNRVMGITAIRISPNQREESTLVLVPGQAPYGIMFEGDIIRMELSVGLEAGATHIGIYRTISGLDSGEAATNTLDTDWHLVDTVILPSNGQLVYFDGGSATTDPLDLLLSKNFYPATGSYNFMGLLESGWIWAGNTDGLIDFSERYMPHAWPTENRLELRTTVTHMKSNGDNIYVGTVNYPFVVAISPGEGEQGAQGAAVAFSERLPCLPRTMSPNASGVLYASPTGIVSLSKSGAQVLSAGIMNPGDILYRLGRWDYSTNKLYYVDQKIENTVFGINWNGKYFGFIDSLPEYYLGGG